MKKILLVIAVLLLCSCDDEPKPLSDMDIVTCDVNTMLNNKDAVRGISATDMLNECGVLANYLGKEPPFGLLKDMSKAWLAFKENGYTGEAGELTDRVMRITKLRGQLNGSHDLIMNNYDIVFRMYTAWNKDISPDDVIAFLENSGVEAKNLSDDGLVKIMAMQK